MAELKPMKVEVESKHAFRPVHYLAALSWLNFFTLFWVVLFDLLPEQVSGPFVGLAALMFFLLAMGASMIAYQGGGK